MPLWMAALLCGVLFVNTFSESLGWYDAARQPLTADGALLNKAGYDRFSKFLIDSLFGAKAQRAASHRELVHQAVEVERFGLDVEPRDLFVVVEHAGFVPASGNRRHEALTARPGVGETSRL